MHLCTTLLTPGRVATFTGFCELISVLCSGSKVSSHFQCVASIKIKDLPLILGMTDMLSHIVQKKKSVPHSGHQTSFIDLLQPSGNPLSSDVHTKKNYPDGSNSLVLRCFKCLSEPKGVASQSLLKFSSKSQRVFHLENKSHNCREQSRSSEWTAEWTVTWQHAGPLLLSAHHSEPVDTINCSRPLRGSAEEARTVEIRVDFRKPDTHIS